MHHKRISLEAFCFGDTGQQSHTASELRAQNVGGNERLIAARPYTSVLVLLAFLDKNKSTYPFDEGVCAE